MTKHELQIAWCEFRRKMAEHPKRQTDRRLDVSGRSAEVCAIQGIPKRGRRPRKECCPVNAICTQVLGPDRYTRCSCIKATDDDGNTAIVSYNHALSGLAAHFEAVKALCAKMGWTGTMAWGALRDGYVFVWTTNDDTLTVER